MKRTDGQPTDNMGDDVLKEETIIASHRSLALKLTDHKPKEASTYDVLKDYGFFELNLSNFLCWATDPY